VIPSTVLGLVVLAAALGPGYVFIRVEERRRPRPGRSALLETAELVVIGGLASTVAFAVVGGIAAHTRWLDESKLADSSSKYLLSHASRFALLLLITLALACAVAFLVARLLFHRYPATIKAHSAWDEYLADQEGVINYATVGLDDGVVVAGDVVGHSVGQRSADERELILMDPEVRGVNDQFLVRARDQFVILRGDRIRTLGLVKYQGVLPKAERPKPWHNKLKALGTSLWTWLTTVPDRASSSTPAKPAAPGATGAPSERSPQGQVPQA
jgi:hypothetical protein